MNDLHVYIYIYIYIYITEDMCKEVECGKGTCKWNGALPLGFTCQCEAGWKHTRDQDDEDDYPFLPCVIPNCKYIYSLH